MTARQQRAIKLVLEKGIPVSHAMKEAGYSLSVAKNPQELTRSKAWFETLDKAGLSDEYLVKKHKRLLSSKKEEISVRALDLAYKVKGKYETGNKGAQFNAPVQIVINPPREPAIEPHIIDTDIDSNGV